MTKSEKFLNDCGLTEQFGIRHPAAPRVDLGPYDEWYEDAADCFITFADDAEDGAVMVHRWVSDTWQI